MTLPCIACGGDPTTCHCWDGLDDIKPPVFRSAPMVLQRIGTIKSLEAFGEVFHNMPVRIVGKYQHDGTPVIKVFTDEGSPWCHLTMCSPSAELGPNEVLVKTWSENEPIAEALRNSDMFEDTGRRVRTGYCVAEIWRIK